MTGPAVHLCLVRHGQTDWNLAGRYQGQSDVPLNQTGCLQARAAARKLRGQPFSAVYSSDLQRAYRTASIIAETLNLPVTTEPRLREINQGEWEGLHVDVIQSRYAQMWQQRSLDPAAFRPPGGETVREVAARVYAALDDIAAAHSAVHSAVHSAARPAARVLIVAHGLSLAVILCQARAVPLAQAYQHIPPNAEPVWVRWGG